MSGILVGLVGLGVIAVVTYRGLRGRRARRKAALGTRSPRVAGMDNPAVTNRRFLLPNVSSLTPSP